MKEHLCLIRKHLLVWSINAFITNAQRIWFLKDSPFLLKVKGTRTMNVLKSESCKALSIIKDEQWVFDVVLWLIVVFKGEQ